MSSPRLRILVVEDDDDSRELMAGVLRRTGDHVIALANSGEEGLVHLRGDEAYDLIVTDIGLPGVSGLEMLDQAARDGCIDRTTVVVCSACTSLRPQALARGARCLAKPLDPQEIFDVVRKRRLAS
jgi:CheY-like chemotaxis protein